MYIKKWILITSLCILPTMILNAQHAERKKNRSQDSSIVIKTNLLYDITSTINFGIEYEMSEKYTIDISANVNPWQFKDTKLKHFLIQPEVRWWNKKAFEGFFVGAHILYAGYNVGKINASTLGLVDNLKTDYYNGYLMGAGISIGQTWRLSEKLNIEATIGGGFGYMEWDRLRKKCGYMEFIENKSKYTFFPTKAGITLVYSFNK